MGNKTVNFKPVDKQEFEEAIQMVVNGCFQDDAAKHCGLSRPTFAKRVNQYFSPERFGKLPEGFFK